MAENNEKPIYGHFLILYVLYNKSFTTFLWHFLTTRFLEICRKYSHMLLQILQNLPNESQWVGFVELKHSPGNSFQNRGKVSELGKMIIKLPYLSDHYPMIMHSLGEDFRDR